ncbi:MAG: putative capsid protein [Cressdnaviricota sp.]|nr:MAG: putative capsid protein [Cressdnaviricota sp.]
MVDRGRSMRGVKKTIYKKKSYKKRNYGNKKLVNLIKSVNIRQSESKYKSTSYTWGALTHDNTYHKDLWSSTVNLFPGQGTSDVNRIGDRIICQGIMLRAVFDVPWDRKNVKLKMFYVPWNSDQGTPATYSNFFHNITGNARLDPVQKKRYPGVKYLGTYQIEVERAPYYTYSAGDQVPSASVISANTGSICIKKWIPMYNKKLFFRSDATFQPSNLPEQGSILVVPYSTINTNAGGGVIPGDNIILSGEMSATLYFKDL